MGRDSSVHVTGAGGQVGRELRRLAPGARYWTKDELDVTERDAVRDALRGATAIVHLAAMTNVDQCEREPDRAFSVNADGTANVVAAAASVGARVLFVSTDYVFDGYKEGAYVEDDRPAPINVYGASKRRGEETTLEVDDNVVVRTSWVYGPGRNFIATIVDAASRGRTLEVVDDQIGRPTWARDLAGALHDLLDTDVTGIVHVAGEGEPCSWADLAEVALDAAGVNVPVARVDTATYASRLGRPPAPRPRNSTLALDRARSLGLRLPDWRDSVREYVAEAS